MQAQEFKLILLGDHGVGKTQFIHNFLPEDARQPSVFATEIHQLSLHTNRGVMKFNVWDTAGQQQVAALRHSFTEGQCAIIMFDITSRISFKDVANWYREVTRVCEDIPIVLLGNNAHILDRKVRQKQVISFSQKKGIPYFDLDPRLQHKSIWNLGRPFLHLARKLSGDDDLEFVDFPVPLEHNLSFTAGLSVENALDRILAAHNSGRYNEIQKKQHYYDFLYWNAPAWKRKLKDRAFFSQLAQVAQTHPEAWKQLFWNLLCNFSTTAPVLPSGGSIVPSLLHLCMEAALGDLSMVKYYCQITDEELLVQHCQLIRMKPWIRKEILEDANSILGLSEIGSEYPKFWDLLVDNLLCPPLVLPLK